jgi:saccharopine dehydrogenase-like NADP-dependent oxidoreductase
MRVGALPASSTNEFGYNVNWSVDGLINECNKPCECVIENVVYTDIEPLGGKEDVIIDGIPFEAFYTSGGVGTLTETYTNIELLNYKTLRYPGHLDKFKKYRDDRQLDVLKNRLLKECPFNANDVVYYLISVIGTDNNGNRSEKIVYNKVLNNDWLSAIQITTAYSLCGVVEMYLNKFFDEQSGLIKQENIPLEYFKNTVLIKHSGILGE